MDKKLNPRMSPEFRMGLRTHPVSNGGLNVKAAIEAYMNAEANALKIKNAAIAAANSAYANAVPNALRVLTRVISNAAAEPETKLGEQYTVKPELAKNVNASDALANLSKVISSTPVDLNGLDLAIKTMHAVLVANSPATAAAKQSTSKTVVKQITPRAVVSPVVSKK